MESVVKEKNSQAKKCPVDLLVIWAVIVAFLGRRLSVDKGWWHSSAKYSDYTTRPDYIIYQKARKRIALYPKLENLLLRYKII